MPFEERDRINRMYDDLRNACIDAVKILAKLFQLPYDLKYDGIKLVPDKSVIEKEIRKNFIVPLTDEQREYFTLIASVHNAIADLNQYETEHKLNEFSVRGYSDINNEGDTLRRTKILSVIADLQRMDRDETKDDKQLIHFFLPLTCKRCNLYMAEQQRRINEKQ
jgi:hypothetical protein